MTIPARVLTALVFWLAVCGALCWLTYHATRLAWRTFWED